MDYKLLSQLLRKRPCTRLANSLSSNPLRAAMTLQGSGLAPLVFPGVAFPRQQTDHAERSQPSGPSEKAGRQAEKAEKWVESN